ncbi:P-loop containing protein [Fusarium beomiforme]|uniref:P-loop containing protein n=1 Tax=Fusarium beomiforme TaxID=44412 RepID=A0A9P5DV91_9HYPO|nr:P-loop containing protein [Fusarium beomiforme]
MDWGTQEWAPEWGSSNDIPNQISDPSEFTPEYLDEVDKLGEVCEIRDAFAKIDIYGRFVKWLDEMPYGEELKEVREIKRVRDTYAVVCGRYPTKDSTWEVRTIWINNPILVDVLRNIFMGHPDVECRAQTLEFKQPFVPLIHRWEQLCKLAVDNPENLSRVKKIKETGSSSFEDLKFVFKPGKLFFCSQTPIAAGISRSYVSGYLEVSQVRWSGSEYSTTISSFHVPYYHGLMPLSDLSVRPYWACPEHDIKVLRDTLVKRGQAQLWEDGWKTPEDNAIPKDIRLPIQAAEGRVIVDADGGPDELGLRNHGPLDSLGISSAMYTHEDGSKASISDGHRDYEKVRDPENEKGEDDPDRLTDEEAMLTVSTVNCFSIERKVWRNAEIDHLVDIEWNTQAFDKLVLDDAENRLLVRFVGATKNGQLQYFDDFVFGKGKGLVMLLCGPPGMDPKKLEGNLKTALDRCARWDAILLLDEADLFLEKRTSSNLAQNEMTIIFLRLLEYYQGVMILTTNRYPAIDPAFESRIDLSFVFQDLEPASRAKIWYNFLIRESKALAEDSDAIAKLASMPLNGRQIKSAAKTARILAASENLPLATDHLQTVVFMRMKALQLLD